MKIETLQNLIAEWLTDTPLPPLTPRLKPLVKAEELTSVLAIVGPRRAGKTYFMFQIIKELLDSGLAKRDDILFVDFEDFRLKEFIAEDIDNLFVSFNKLTGKTPRYLFFDEVQNIRDWSRMLRSLHNRKKFKIIVSGSNSSLLSREIATELRGRYTDEIMFPFSFMEFLRLRNIPFDAITLHTVRKGEVLAAFDDYLQYGGFPEVASKINQGDKRKLLQNYYDTIFHRDVIERHGIKAEHILDRIMRSILENYSEQFSVSKFEKQLKSAGLHGSKRTLANYLKFLEGAFFILKSEKFSYSVRVRTMNPCKVYLIDTGFSFLGSPFSENRGKLLENIVAQELLRRGYQLFFFKGRGECDFILKQGTKPDKAIQVCWELNQKNEKRELSGLAEAMKEFNLKQGMILTYNQENVVNHDCYEFTLLPVWKWLIPDN
jgi:predicted AAA+ superfamily ATPase